MLGPGDQIESTESFICGIINMVTASLLAVMVVITLVGWLSFITVLTPKVPEGVRINAARVIWAYVAAGDLLRKHLQMLKFNAVLPSPALTAETKDHRSSG